MKKFKLNLKTIPKYLDILRSQANTKKIRASIAHLWRRVWHNKDTEVADAQLYYQEYESVIYVLSRVFHKILSDERKTNEQCNII